jgi:16S rRNA (guanine527-N7)-methyltransferase
VTPEQGLALIDKVNSVSRETRQRLTDYHDVLVQWQSRINLIAPSTTDQIWQRHILDSVQFYRHLDNAKNIVDIGSGAGFPGLVIAILLAESRTGTVRLIESNGKKCAFMNAVIRHTRLRETGLDVIVHNARIEDALPGIQSVDIITARALASLDDLLRLTQCHLDNGTQALFAKGLDHQTELETARQNWRFNCEKSDSLLQDGSVILKISELKPR